MSMTFSAHLAQTADGKPDLWLVVDEFFDLHRQASDFCMSLMAAQRSPNTLRSYSSKVASFLTWCSSIGIRWDKVTFIQLGSYVRFICDTPKRDGEPRSAKTVNLYVVAVTEFLRWAYLQGRVSSTLINQLSRPKHLRYTPSNFDPGEQDQFRYIAKSNLKVSTEECRVPVLEAEQAERVMRACLNPRDVFLLTIMLQSGLRIGEALGLHREDLHFLPDSRSLSCPTRGPHVHVRRRVNSNGSYAKSPVPRSVPVTTDTVLAYREYLFAKQTIVARSQINFVFLNLYGESPDTPMRYRNAKRCTDRIAKAAGIKFSPHVLRHSAANGWRQNGVERDVLQELLGHVSSASTEIYLHISEAEMRAAVDGVRQDAMPVQWD